MLLVDQNKWEKVIKMIMNIFDDVVKWIKNVGYKNGWYICIIFY